jgi:hypothetical protein
MSIYLISSILLIFNLGLNKYILLFAFIITVLLIFFIVKENGFIKKIIYILILIFIVILSIIISTNIYDISYDGQSYHQIALMSLNDNWNPYYTPLSENIWVSHYPKASWLVASTILKFTGNIEAGKSTNLILIFASYFLVLSFLLMFEKISFGFAFFVSLICSFNPVSIYQSLTYYIDGQIATLLLILCVLSFLIFKENNMLVFLLYGLVIIYIVNLKFTAIVYVTTFIIGLVLFSIFKKKWKDLKYIIATFIIGILLGITIFGYNPYITNFITKGHPFYPLAGKDSIDIMSGNSPYNFSGKNRFEKFLLSFFGETSNLALEDSKESTRLKIPFAFKPKEVIWFAGPDPRINGFGVFYSGIFILSFVGLFISYLKRLTINLKIYMFIILILILSVFVNPECWWARYVPQLYFIPITILIYLYLINKKWTKTWSLVILALLILNQSSIGATNYFYNMTKTNYINNILKNIKERNETKVDVLLFFKSTKIKLEKFGIKYNEVRNVKDLKCKKPIDLLKSKICIN